MNGLRRFLAVLVSEALCWASAGFVAVVLFVGSVAVVGAMEGKLAVWLAAVRSWLVGV